ncbi:MAG: response regulator [Ignavibacteriaceae bacterium]
MAIKNVLIIDNDEIFISKINGFLWERGVKNVLTASTVSEALEMMGKQIPDLILIDLIPGDITSFDAVQIISKIDNSIRILITSDFYNKDYCNAAFEAGADAFVDKSNFADDLTTILNAVPKRLQALFEKYLLSKN